ncbi:UDP-3-O-(3-hydroxymyristoyl)glucosamine N-acyltransferase [Flocculibacter collagenilyticus]|uniref:UDP-3-O-(3-hydroxymyristoyl)glucosamine N-acyltransferase n=1 Tax=Flocculibacter collagenilyticus TaxID=2744479 RepID=UPI0018F3442E|nr:UDP-3-O-(3-hydroxymyristoyl)glucosamine N-acyltransferase [Flocculibacter collagenilyticus]
MKITLSEIAKLLGAELQGDPTVVIDSIATLQAANKNQITFLSNSKYRKYLDDSNAAAVLLTEKDVPYCSTNKLILANPYVGYAKLAQFLDNTPDAATDIHPTAQISDTATIGSGVSIGANAVIEEGVHLADDVQIGAGCFIGRNASIAKSTKLWANVTVYHEVSIGEQCLVQSGAIIGADGFGYANDQGQWVKIPQVGSVVIGNRVEIGANTCIDRGALDNTEIADGVIIDNLCQIAHNVHIGENSAVAGMTVIAGSVVIGRNCTIAGASAINGHIEICDGVHISGMSMIIKPITEPGVYSSGIPASTNRAWRKNATRFGQLDEMHKRIKQLEAASKDEK